jgi:hypothetical protein
MSDEVEEDGPDLYWTIMDLEFELEHFARVADEGISFPRYIAELVENIKLFRISGAQWGDFARLFRTVEHVQTTMGRSIQTIIDRGNRPTDQLVEFDDCLSRINSDIQDLLEFEAEEIDAEIKRIFAITRAIDSFANAVTSVMNSKGYIPPDSDVPLTEQEIFSRARFSWHPAVAEASSQYLKPPFYRHALEETAKALYNAVISKADRPELKPGGVPSLTKIFSGNNPILRVSEVPDEQTGAMWLFSGMWMHIRNVRAHSDDQNLDSDPVEVAEWLGFLSVLFRLLDRAELVAAEDVGQTGV